MPVNLRMLRRIAQGEEAEALNGSAKGLVAVVLITEAIRKKSTAVDPSHEILLRHSEYTC